MHNRWTPRAGKLFLALGLLAAGAGSSPLFAQQDPAPPPAPDDQTEDLVTFRGPGARNPGAAEIGARGARTSDLSFYVGVNGVYDSNLRSASVDSKGNLIDPGGLFGGGINAGVYGVHSGRRYRLGVDYSGQIRRYAGQSGYNGSDHAFRLGFTQRLSKSLALDLQESAGTIKYGNSAQANALSNDPTSPFSANTSLYDFRRNNLQSAAYLSWLPSARSSFTFGAQGFLTQNKIGATLNGYGYVMSAGYQRRMSRRTTVGATYVYSRYLFEDGLSNSTTNTVHGTFAYGIGNRWSVSLQAGVSQSSINSVQVLRLDPALAAVFGRATVAIPSAQSTYYPDGALDLRRKFGRAVLDLNYFIGVGADIQFLGTTRRQAGAVSYYYTATRRVTLSATGSYYSSSVIGLEASKYGQFSGSGGVAYYLAKGMNLVGSYYVRRQDVDVTTYKRTTNGLTIGLTYASGSLPLRLW